MYNKQKKIDNAHFSKKNVLIAKKRPLKMTSTTFLFREAEQLGVYQLLPNLTIWHQWACEHLCKTSVENSGPLSLQQTQSHYINWLDYYIVTTLAGVGCYILLLPVCKVEMWEKLQILCVFLEFFVKRGGSGLFFVAWQLSQIVK